MATYRKRRCRDCEHCRCGLKDLEGSVVCFAWCTMEVWGPIQKDQFEKRPGMGTGCKQFVSMDDE